MSSRYVFGEWLDDSHPLTAADAIAICEQADARRAALADYPIERILALFGRLKTLWSDPAYPPRQKLIAELPALTGFSREMTELAFGELGSVFEPAELRKKLDRELRGLPPYGAGEPGAKTELTWHPLGTVLHVLSGNVFLVAAGSLIEGLLTRNITVLKMASGENLFLPELLRSIQAVDEDGVISRSIAALDFRSSQKEVMRELKSRVDGIIVWGGEEAVRGWREGLPAHTRLIVFGPKLSFAVVTKQGLARTSLSDAARRIAQELAIWDQNACTAPQMCFVEGLETALALADSLGAEMAAIQRKLPAGPADRDTAIEIQKLRGIYEIAEARGEGALRASTGNVDWTIVVDPTRRPDPSPLHRTLKLIPFSSQEEVLGEAAALRGYLQTVGILAGEQETTTLARELARLGADRLLELGQMSAGEIDDPHDGAYDLPQLLKLAMARHIGQVCRIGRHDARQAEIIRRLAHLIETAKKSPFYAARIGAQAITMPTDLAKLPRLTREEMEAGMPPFGTSLATVDRFAGGYVTRSGGSTGEPKFSIMDGGDWKRLVAHASEMFREMGLVPGDRLANCMLAGDLYGSFVSFDHINCHLGVTTFAFAGSVKADNLVSTWRKFGINAIQGIPSSIMPVLRAAHALAPDFRLEKVVYAGCPLATSDAEWLRENLGVKRISSVIGANDGAQFAFQCEHLSGAQHHTVDEYNYVEIIDDHGQPVADGEVGRLLITTLQKLAFPLIRYEIGDQARVVPGGETCPCGSGRRVIEYLGRCDDILSIGMMNAGLRDFQAALSDLPISVLQLVGAYSETGQERVIIRLEAECVTEESVRSRLMAKIRGMGENLEKGAIDRLDIQILKPGTLPRNPRSGKVKGVVDERQSS